MLFIVNTVMKISSKTLLQTSIVFFLVIAGLFLCAYSLINKADARNNWWSRFIILAADEDTDLDELEADLKDSGIYNSIHRGNSMIHMSNYLDTPKRLFATLNLMEDDRRKTEYAVNFASMFTGQLKSRQYNLLFVPVEYRARLEGFLVSNKTNASGDLFIPDKLNPIVFRLAVLLLAVFFWIIVPAGINSYCIRTAPALALAVTGILTLDPAMTAAIGLFLFMITSISAHYFASMEELYFWKNTSIPDFVVKMNVIPAILAVGCSIAAYAALSSLAGVFSLLNMLVGILGVYGGMCYLLYIRLRRFDFKKFMPVSITHSRPGLLYAGRRLIFFILSIVLFVFGLVSFQKQTAFQGPLPQKQLHTNSDLTHNEFSRDTISLPQYVRHRFIQDAVPYVKINQPLEGLSRIEMPVYQEDNNAIKEHRKTIVALDSRKAAEYLVDAPKGPAYILYKENKLQAPHAAYSGIEKMNFPILLFLLAILAVFIVFYTSRIETSGSYGLHKRS